MDSLGSSNLSSEGLVKSIAKTLILLRDLEQQNQSLNTGVEVSRVGDSVKGIDMREEQCFREAQRRGKLCSYR